MRKCELGIGLGDALLTVVRIRAGLYTNNRFVCSTHVQDEFG